MRLHFIANAKFKQPDCLNCVYHDLNAKKMYKELSKPDKKVARIVIDKGIDKEFGNILENAERILKEWRTGSLSNKDAYHKLFKHIDKSDNHIARRYDGLGGSRYFQVVVSLYAEGLATDEDIEPFSEQTKAELKQWLQLL